MTRGHPVICSTGAVWPHTIFDMIQKQPHFAWWPKWGSGNSLQGSPHLYTIVAVTQRAQFSPLFYRSFRRRGSGGIELNWHTYIHILATAEFLIYFSDCVVVDSQLYNGKYEAVLKHVQPASTLKPFDVALPNLTWDPNERRFFYGFDCSTTHLLVWPQCSQGACQQADC